MAVSQRIFGVRSRMTSRLAQNADYCPNLNQSMEDVEAGEDVIATQTITRSREEVCLTSSDDLIRSMIDHTTLCEVILDKQNVDEFKNHPWIRGVIDTKYEGNSAKVIVKANRNLLALIKSSKLIKEFRSIE